MCVRKHARLGGSGACPPPETFSCLDDRISGHSEVKYEKATQGGYGHATSIVPKF